MDDLRTLVGSASEAESGVGSERRRRAGTAALRALVGAPEVAAAPELGVAPGALKQLVGAPEAAAVPVSSMAPGALRQMVGPPVDSIEPTPSIDLSSLVGGTEATSRSASQRDLSTLVGDGGSAAVGDGWLAPELAQAGKRPLFGGRRRSGAVNYMSIAAAILAVVAIVGTVSFAVVQRATANPADDAMVSLREREAELANHTKILQTAADLYAASVVEASQLAVASEPVLLALEGRVDAGPLAAAGASRAALLQASGAAEPVMIPEYEREPIDEKSLADVGAAIDRVRLAKDSLPALVTEARDARAQITSAVAAFRDALGALGAAIQTGSENVVATNGSAAQSFRDAVIDAAIRITTAQRAGGNGLAEMPAYAAAVDALRGENQRVLALEEAERESAPTRPSPRSPGSGGTDSGGSSNPGSDTGGAEGGNNGQTDDGGTGTGGDTGGGNTGGGDTGGGNTGGGDTGGGDTGGGDTGGDVGGGETGAGDGGGGDPGSISPSVGTP